MDGSNFLHVDPHAKLLSFELNSLISSIYSGSMLSKFVIDVSMQMRNLFKVPIDGKKSYAGVSISSYLSIL